MARRGISIDETRHLRRSTPSELMGAVIEAVGATGGYRTASATLERMTFARSFRPRWATIAAAVLGVTGVGLFLLLVRSTETFTLSIEEDHSGTRVRIHGRILPMVLDELRALTDGDRPVRHDGAPKGTVDRPMVEALAGASLTPAAPIPAQSPWLLPSGEPNLAEPRVDPAGGVLVDDRTRMVGGRSEPSSPSEPGWVLHLDDGRPIDLTGVVVIGRNPVGSDGDPPELILIAVADDSVSKTHAAVGVDEDGPWVVDRYSTNGTSVADLSGDRRLAPGERARVGDGAVVRLGECSIRVVAR